MFCSGTTLTVIQTNFPHIRNIGHSPQQRIALAILDIPDRIEVETLEGSLFAQVRTAHVVTHPRGFRDGAGIAIVVEGNPATIAFSSRAMARSVILLKISRGIVIIHLAFVIPDKGAYLQHIRSRCRRISKVFDAALQITRRIGIVYGTLIVPGKCACMVKAALDIARSKAHLNDAFLVIDRSKSTDIEQADVVEPSCPIDIFIFSLLEYIACSKTPPNGTVVPEDESAGAIPGNANGARRIATFNHTGKFVVIYKARIPIFNINRSVTVRNGATVAYRKPGNIPTRRRL